MQGATWRLGPLETQFFAWAQMRRVLVVRTGDLVRALALTPQQEADLFKNMGQAGRVIQLQRGLYAVPPRLPPGGRWTPSPLLLVSTLMRELGAKYQITGLAAFHLHGLNKQVPIETCVYNTVLSGRREIAALPFLFIKVAQKSLGGVQNIEIKGTDQTAVFSSLPRAVYDGVYDYSRFGTLPKAFDWISERTRDKKFIQSLVDMAITYGNVGTRRRIGCWLEQLSVAPTQVRRLLRSVSKTAAFIRLVPGSEKGGHANSRWGVLVNYEASHDQAA